MPPTPLNELCPWITVSSFARSSTHRSGRRGASQREPPAAPMILAGIQSAAVWTLTKPATLAAKGVKPAPLVPPRRSQPCRPVEIQPHVAHREHQVQSVDHRLLPVAEAAGRVGLQFSAAGVDS